jgi:hypothetical protein
MKEVGFKMRMIEGLAFTLQKEDSCDLQVKKRWNIIVEIMGK